MKVLREVLGKWRTSVKSVGIIGGADGPTAIFISGKESENRTNESQELTEEVAESITANGRDFSQIHNHLIEYYKAEPVTLSPIQRQCLKVNVIMNYFPQVLNRPEPLKYNPSKEELMEYCKKDTSFEEARKYPAEKLGLDMRGYKVSYGEVKDAIVELEMITGYMSIHNGSNKLTNELILWLGVTQEDIDNKTPKFIRYALSIKGKNNN